MRYHSIRPDNAAPREWLEALLQERRWFGYRRLHMPLRRERHAVNRQPVQWLCREERPTVPRRCGCKRALSARWPMKAPLSANQGWSLHLVADQFTDGRAFRTLDLDCDYTLECLARDGHLDYRLPRGPRI